MLLSCRPSRRARSVLVVCVRRPRPSFRARRVCVAVHRAAAPAHQYARVFCVRRYSTSWARGARVDELPPSSAPDTSPRRHGPFLASWSIFMPARGSKNAAGAAEAHEAAAQPARTPRRGAPSLAAPRRWRRGAVAPSNKPCAGSAAFPLARLTPRRRPGQPAPSVVHLLPGQPRRRARGVCFLLVPYHLCDLSLRHWPQQSRARPVLELAAGCQGTYRSTVWYRRYLTLPYKYVQFMRWPRLKST